MNRKPKETKKIKGKKILPFSIRMGEVLGRSIICADETTRFKVEVDHMFKAILEQPNGPFAVILPTIQIPAAKFCELFVQAYLKKFENIDEKKADKLYTAEKKIASKPENRGNILHSLSESTIATLNEASEWAEMLHNDYVCSHHVLLSILMQEGTILEKILLDFGVDSEQIVDTLVSEFDGRDMTTDSVENSKNLSQQAATINIVKTDSSKVTEKTNTNNKEFLSVLTDEEKSVFEKYCFPVKTDNSAPVIGREEESSRLIEILLRKNKSNPLMIGPAGGGKTSCVTLIAKKIASGNVPEGLKNKVIFSIDPFSLVSGSKYRGDMESRVLTLIKAWSKLPNLILACDEIHNIMGMGRSNEDGGGDIANMLKPYLTDGSLSLIGATTEEEYKKHIQKDKAIERRFQVVKISEPNEKDAKEIIKNMIPYYCNHHKVEAEENMEDIIYKFGKTIKGRVFPDIGADLLDLGCVRASMGKSKLSESIIKEVTSDILGRVKKDSFGF